MGASFIGRGNHRSTKPGVGSSNLPGRATNENRSETVELADLKPPKFDYLAAYLALGLTPEQARALRARTLRLGKRAARGEISLQFAQELSDIQVLADLAVLPVGEGRPS